MWIANKPFRYRGVSYQIGDQVPAERWPNRKLLFATRRIRLSESSEPTPPTPSYEDAVPSKMKRAELNEYATFLGIEGASDYGNRDDLLKKVLEVLKPASPSEDLGGSTDESIENDEDDGESTQNEEDEEDPFSDLDDDEDGNDE